MRNFREMRKVTPPLQNTSKSTVAIYYIAESRSESRLQRILTYVTMKLCNLVACCWREKFGRSWTSTNMCTYAYISEPVAYFHVLFVSPGQISGAGTQCAWKRRYCKFYYTLNFFSKISNYCLKIPELAMFTLFKKINDGDFWLYFECLMLPTHVCDRLQLGCLK